MKKKKNTYTPRKELPGLDQLKTELNREKYKNRYGRVFKNTICTLVVVSAFAVLVAMLYMPILQIYGSSMEPTLQEGDIVVSVKGTDIETGDLVAFYLGNRILVKRCIAGPGQWVNIDKDGNVYVNGELLKEDYLEKKVFGECDIQLPYQVPENRYFVLGDSRDTSADSRNTAVGCVSKEQMIGEIIFRVWPPISFGPLN